MSDPNKRTRKGFEQLARMLDGDYSEKIDGEAENSSLERVDEVLGMDPAEDARRRSVNRFPPLTPQDEIEIWDMGHKEPLDTAALGRVILALAAFWLLLLGLLFG